MTARLLKYVLQGALKGIEEYEAMLEKEHIDPTGKLGQLIKPDENLSEPAKPKSEPVKKESKTVETSTPIDLNDLLEDI